MSSYIHPRLKTWLVIAELLQEAAKLGQDRVKDLQRRKLPPRTAPKRNPGENTPMWNAVATLLATETQEHGSKSRLARYLGVPPQRVTDWIRGRRRLPEAETTLQILYWLNERKAGRDPSI